MELKEAGYSQERRNARNSYGVFYRQFVMGFDTNSPKLFCFFEGKDDPKYYEMRIRTKILDEFRQSTIKVETEYIICEGKNNVLKIAELVDNNNEYKNFKNTWIMFFVDKDCDNTEDLKKSSVNIYVTPCFSIENLYLSQNVFERILKTEFCLNSFEHNDSLNLIKARSFYKEALEQFNNVMEDLNAYLYIQTKRQSKDPYFRMDLDEVKNLDKFCEIKLEKEKIEVKRKQVQYIDELKIKFPHLQQITEDELEEQKKIFRTKENRTEIFRGKYLLLFLKKMLEKILPEMNKKDSNIFLTRQTISISVSLQLPQDTGNMLGRFSQYAETPNCLHEFLSEICKNITIDIMKRLVMSI